MILSESVRRKLRPHPPPDPAASYLRGLLLLRQGKRREAFHFLAEAAGLAPDYGLFRLKLAETRYLLSGTTRTPGLAADLKAALALMPDDGWVHNFAAHIMLSHKKTTDSHLAAAEEHLRKAAAALGDIPAVRVNRGTLWYLRGSLDDALKMLDTGAEDDHEGMLAHCAGKLLVRSGDFEQAAVLYRRALDRAPDNIEYLSGYAACLIELKQFGQAEELLIHARNKNPSPEILKLIRQLKAQKKKKAARPAAKTKAAVSKSKPTEPKRGPGRPRKNPPKV